MAGQHGSLITRSIKSEQSHFGSATVMETKRYSASVNDLAIVRCFLEL